LDWADRSIRGAAPHKVIIIQSRRWKKKRCCGYPE
jgi:hypothetical protein